MNFKVHQKTSKNAGRRCSKRSRRQTALPVKDELPGLRIGVIPSAVKQMKYIILQMKSKTIGLKLRTGYDLRLPPVPSAIEADGIVEPAAHLAPAAAAFETEPGNSTGIRSNTRRDCSRNSSGIAAREMQPASQSTAMPLRPSLQRSAASFTANPSE